jgi:UDP-glucose 4-epimerase
MSTFLVTGGCGFIGSHLCERLQQQGHRVRILDNLSTGRRDNISSSIELIIGDIADPQCVARAMIDVDGCFHLAAIASVQRSVEDWLGTHETNLTGAITIFNEARRPGHPAVPVVYASSAAVYGDNDVMPLSERSAVRPMTAYGADKLGCEQHARVATLVHGIPTCGLRFFNVYGPRQDPRSPYSGVISIFADRLLSDQILSIFGNGRQERDFVYVGDVVDHLIAAMDTTQSTGNATARVYNVCTGRGTSIRDLAQILSETIGTRLQIQFHPPKPGDIQASLGDPSHGMAELGVQAATTLQDGLRHTVNYMRPALAA